ncbi:cyclic peptide export ABC transporter [Nisaea nitritireducens]|uniref:cyclic peptide export ABC transporter n=1 Tax=Nisaea nitritireducens TaxID=568392 RepID=UPI00186676E7|nr:cyclic peptide export ABC transporter [Nisaea nitritireducens]
MKILSFFAEKGQYSRRFILMLVAASGMSGGLLLAVINTAAEMAANSEVQLRFFAIFALTLLFFTVTKRVALSRATRAGERAIREVRIRLADKIRHSELLFVENTGRGDIYARLTQDTASISQAVPMIFNGYQSAVILVAGLIYIAFVSWIACILTILFLSVIGFAYVRNSRLIVADLRTATAKEAQFFDALSHLVDGFKEIKLNHRKNDEVTERVAEIAKQTETVMVNTGLRYVTYLVGSQTSLYLLIATLVFVFPTMEFADPERILKLTAAGLFIISPLEVAFTAYYFHNKAEVAFKNIEQLEEKLDAALEEQDVSYKPNGRSWENFKTISLKGLQFQYPGDGETYSIGPLDLEIEREKLTFITGGNGSGKSTLLKVLTGLYLPKSGEIRVDRHPIKVEDYPDYRELFSAIFSDFHLFDRLYGLGDVNPDEVHRLLEEMQIDNKTSYVDNAFSNIDLSTGQKKRLAMVITMLEDKPILVFDEWAADQDPQFRRIFYEDILPSLKSAGKTVIVVTHDDAYFEHADKLIKLDYGKLVEI